MLSSTLRIPRWLAAFCLLAALLRTGVAEEYPPKVQGEPPIPRVEVTGRDQESWVLTPESLKDLDRVVVEAKDRDGQVHKFEGVELYELLRKVKAPANDQLRGEWMRSFATVAGRDGYTVCFSLQELSPGFSERRIVLVDQCDGAPLPQGIGPFRIVAPDDKKHARWVRDVVSIRILDSRNVRLGENK